jgi:hypothetical protein
MVRRYQVAQDSGGELGSTGEGYPQS